MKSNVIALAIMLVVAGNAMTSEVKRWRQHQILCNQNSSAVRGKHGRWIWVKERPLICGHIDVKMATKEKSVASIVMIVVETFACRCCHIFITVLRTTATKFIEDWHNVEK